LATASWDRTVRIWDLSTGQEIESERQDHPSPVLWVVYSPDGSLLASSTDDRLIQVRDTATGQELFNPPLRLPEEVRCLAFSPRGTHLAAACSDWTVAIWHVDTKARTIKPQPTTLAAHSLGVTCVTFSPNGRWLASASEDQTVKIWNMDEIQSGNTIPEKTLPHNTGVASVAFSHDNHRLVSLGRDGYVRCWDPAAEQELFAFTRRHASGRSPGILVGFNPDPNRQQLATAFEDGPIEIRDWKTLPTGSP
jgi:WD40 repeat protein